jgi:hypothetical protein
LFDPRISSCRLFICIPKGACHKLPASEWYYRTLRPIYVDGPIIRSGPPFHAGQYLDGRMFLFNKLLPLKEFEQEQRNLVKAQNALLPNVSQEMNLPTARVRIWLDCIDVPMDIGSEVIQRSFRAMWQATWVRPCSGVANNRHAPISPWLHTGGTRSILEKETKSVHECYFLGGRLFLCLGFYHQSSWVWNWLPVGAR